MNSHATRFFARNILQLNVCAAVATVVAFSLAGCNKQEKSTSGILPHLTLPMQPGPQHAPCYRREGLSLSPPPGFVAADRFGGFVDETSGDSIFTVTQQISIMDQKALNTDAALAKSFVEVSSRQPVTLGSYEGEIITALQMGTIEKLIVIFGDSKRSAMIMATAQSPWDQARRSAIREALLSVVYAPSENSQSP